MLPKCECGADQAPGRTITASEFDEAVESCITEDGTVPPHKFAELLGVVCVPDPEPTNAEKLAKAMCDWMDSRAEPIEFPVASFASHLDAIGVRVPDRD